MPSCVKKHLSRITRIGHLRAEIQQISKIWWPFWIMQIRYFPLLGFLRTFSMVFWGPNRNTLWQKKLCCNLFQVKPYFAWTTIRRTRNVNMFERRFVRTELKSVSLSNCGVKLWNGLEINLKSCRNVQVFKKCFKEKCVHTYD